MLVQTECSHTALNQVIISKSTIFASVRVCKIEGKQGKTASVNAGQRETELEMVSEFLFFVIAALDCQNLASIPKCL